jgi:serine/threonine protein kinase
MERLGPYAISARIASGGLADVYRATRFGAAGFERTVAIKVLRPEHRAVAERWFIEEARIGALVRHQNIVSVEDFGYDNDTYYLVMEHVDGTTLQAAGPLELPRKLDIISDVARALSHVHALGIVHRDINPTNILISLAGEVKLCDFGIAKATLFSDQTWGTLQKGTYAYMSPEQARGETLSATSDILSLGIVLAELCGTHPFLRETPLATMHAIKHAESPMLEGIPPQVRAIVERCLLARDVSAADLSQLLRDLHYHGNV